jgi:SlyX protein
MFSVSEKGDMSIFACSGSIRGNRHAKIDMSPFSQLILRGMTDKLALIEEKLAFLERAVNELSDVVARQQKELDRATDRHQRLMDKLSAMESDWGASATAEEKPPHY